MLAWIICSKHVWLNMTCIAIYPSMYTLMSDDNALKQRLSKGVKYASQLCNQNFM